MATMTICHSLDLVSGLNDSSISKLSSTYLDETTGQFVNTAAIKQLEYPSLLRTTYLDHAGTTLYPKSLIDSYAHELKSNLFGNPHSASAGSQLSSRRIEDVRLKVLKFFDADPEIFDIVFVANATAAIKLVAEAFRDHPEGFEYAYHADSHTSLVGVRELAQHGSHYLLDDASTEAWIENLYNNTQGDNLKLLGYPGQSNLTGRKLPLAWGARVRSATRAAGQHVYTLLDAAGLASTSPLSLDDAASAPDFVALSFYKIFGFPDLGALVVRKESAPILMGKKYFGGGTVDMITVGAKHLNVKKQTVHGCLEEGTLPFHTILALDHAISVHYRLFGSMHNVRRHTTSLSDNMRDRLKALRHGNSAPVCTIYEDVDRSRNGPVIALNLLDSSGCHISVTEVGKLCMAQNIQLRTGGMCNPGGISTYLPISEDEVLANFASGHRCSGEEDIRNGKPTGVLRISFGAMSDQSDVDRFMEFVNEFYVEQVVVDHEEVTPSANIFDSSFYVESISVFPIKSCASYKVDANTSWPVTPKGLAFDREWCLVHAGTGIAMSQKRFPRMALLQPSIDLIHRKLEICFRPPDSAVRELQIDLDESLDTRRSAVSTCPKSDFRIQQSTLCGENVRVQVYTSNTVNDFFTDALEVPCVLARYVEDKSNIRRVERRQPTSYYSNSDDAQRNPSLALSNESPFLLISRSSVNRLNEQIKASNKLDQPQGKTVSADSFRGNIVIAEDRKPGQTESPYAEDDWTSLAVVSSRNDSVPISMQVLGPCQRCQMVCVDQKSAQRRREPFSTLTKTRRKDGKVWFGMHLALSEVDGADEVPSSLSIRVGDRVMTNV